MQRHEFVLDRSFINGFLVYEFYSTPTPEPGTCLYVGSTARGLYRPFDMQHEHVRAFKEEAECVKITSFATVEEAKEFERKRIIELRPRYNSSLKYATSRRPLLKVLKDSDIHP